MDATSGIHPFTERDKYYYRQRQKNRVFTEIAAFFAEEAERTGINKRDIADALQRDPAQITRWLSAPSNLTLDTISDLLLSLGAELDYRVCRFADRAKPNAVHPAMEKILSSQSSQAGSSVQAIYGNPIEHVDAEPQITIGSTKSNNEYIVQGL